ncbi:MAG: T9SS type A sorting domain-containing protein [Ignavibacteriaceae bacterium]|nr:T9SS type A sorting domain-containing protein [Ignavibacteriaceae bacterium]
MKKFGPLFLLLAIFCGGLFSNQLLAQNYTFSQIAGFEGTTPSYWNIGNQPVGSTLTWATDQSVSMGHSIKIVKFATSDTAAWVSDNMCDLWSPKMSANMDLLLGAWIKTENVNTNPTSDDQMWWIQFAFYDSAGAEIGTVKLPIDQSVASSTGWVADTTAVGDVSLPKAAWKTIVSFVGGKNATGTVWADNFVLEGRDGNWPGQLWNTQLGVPTGWFYWLPPNGGNDGLLNDGFENTVITSEASHSGNYSLKFVMPAGRDVHDGFIGTHRMALDKIDPTLKPGDKIRIGVWIKASNLVPDSAAKYPTTWAVGLTPLFSSMLDNNDGYDVSGNDGQFTFPSGATSFDWTQYFVDVTIPTDKYDLGMEVRCHVYAQFTGTVYFDDITITKISSPTFAQIAGFEGTAPAYWSIGNQPAGSTLTWATDQSVSMGHSIKIVKSVTSDTAAWVSDNMCDFWSGKMAANMDLLLGAWIKTQNVNINPTTDDQRWWVAFAFYDSAGAEIGTVKLPIDQSMATSTGWVADTTAVGDVSLPKAAWKTIVSFVGGKNATGTVWADNFVLEGRDGNWPGQLWNTQLGVPTGWFYWMPPNGGNDGVLNDGFENTIVTNEAAHSGNYSLKFVMPAGRDVHDGFVGTHRQPFGLIDTSIKVGDHLRISVWIKASGLVPDSAAKYTSTWAVGLSPLFSDQLGNNVGYSVTGSDYTFAFPSVTSFDWTKYSLDVQVPTDKAYIGMETRLHIYSQFVGTVYFDDLTIENLGPNDAVNNQNKILPAQFAVFQNYPNPFNPTTTISYSLPKAISVKVIVYDVLGREVKTLVNTDQKAGIQQVIWNGDNNMGRKVSSGIYMYKVSAGEQVQVKKMIMLK